MDTRMHLRWSWWSRRQLWLARHRPKVVAHLRCRRGLHNPQFTTVYMQNDELIVGGGCYICGDQEWREVCRIDWEMISGGQFCYGRDFPLMTLSAVRQLLCDNGLEYLGEIK